MEMFKNQDANKYVIILNFKGEDKSEAIVRKRLIPTSTTKIITYLYRIYPNSKGVFWKPYIKAYHNG